METEDADVLGVLSPNAIPAMETSTAISSLPLIIAVMARNSRRSRQHDHWLVSLEPAEMGNS